MNNKEDNKIKVIKVLAKAASDQDFHQRLVNEPTKTLNEEGIQGEDFYTPDKRSLESILCMLRCLGDIYEKRS